ncbi:MAG: 2-succinyl-5-enolpyruvyl-6-hydroxy-3-cyclohexene-1-carboxylic-acid synthase [Polyangiales bacterium]|nr:2-succinyl-5-enolpyruvyl-6-hydroxy-3-cyclohexene-1-carboxylic-acid synthase [Myxococcales bacterium]MCB9657151.1 2-succinyl-5-enolpyruvyl-6-hydroxy-3-cyclohexene-1-carboxylic-acid synthase [Sandaracinaceae bacterium]
MHACDLQYASARFLVGAITRATGTTRWVVSPGSRSTPLVLALHQLGVPLHHVIDERAAAFFALGVARETGRVAPLLCTSGTALAHYLPAVIEASETRLPMLVVSADRPPELHGWGANQTITQRGLFGAFVREELDLGCASSLADVDAWRARLSTFLRAGLAGPEVGPLHLNVPLRVPLEPTETGEALVVHHAVDAWVSATPRIVDCAPDSVGDDALRPLRAAVLACHARGARGLLVVGPLARRSDVPAAVLRFARASGFPLLAEAGSQCRFGPVPDGVTRVGCFDALLRAPAARAALAPELVIQVGATPTSKSLELLAQEATCPRFVLAPFGRPDPARNAADILVGDVSSALDALSDALEAEGARSEAATRPYAARLGALDGEAQAIFDRRFAEDTELSEGAVAQAVVDALGETDGFLLGNSLSIRHVDAYARRERPVGGVHTQRGASGIDGLSAGAAGAASTGRAMVALVGDVSFVHDLGGLGAHHADSSLTIVVLQNGGGRIFELLPIARHAGAPMGSFTTEHGADLAAAARVFGHDHVVVRTRAALSEALAARVGRPGLHVVEAVVPPHDAGPVQRALYAEVEALVARAAGGPT